MFIANDPNKINRPATPKKENDSISLTAGEKLTVITTIASPIILVVSLALAVHFGLHPTGHTFHIPLSPFVHMTPLFGLATIPVCVPLIATTGIALGAGCIISVLAVRSEHVKDVFSKAFGALGVTDELVSIKGYTPEELAGLIKINEAAKKISDDDDAKTVEEWLAICVTAAGQEDEEVKAFLQRVQVDAQEKSGQSHFNEKYLTTKGVDIYITDDNGSVYVEYFKELIDEMTQKASLQFTPPAEVQLAEGKLAIIVNFTTEDGVKLGGYWFDAGEKAPVVVLFHGNGMLAHDMKNHATAYAEKGYSVLMPEYRGCGISEGKRDKAMTYQASQKDADAAYHFAKFGLMEDPFMGKDVSDPTVIEKFQPEFTRNVLIHGFSLGAGIAAGLAERMREPLVIDHGFDEPIGVISSTIDAKFETSQGPLQTGVLGIAKGAIFVLKPLLTSILEAKEQDSQAWNTTAKVSKLINPIKVGKEEKKGQKVFILAGNSDTVLRKQCSEKIISENKLQRNKEETRLKINNIVVGHYYLATGGHCANCSNEYLEIATQAKELAW